MPEETVVPAPDDVVVEIVLSRQLYDTIARAIEGHTKPPRREGTRTIIEPLFPNGVVDWVAQVIGANAQQFPAAHAPSEEIVQKQQQVQQLQEEIRLANLPVVRVR